MNDILNRSDIEFLINSFYNKVQKDELISFFFTDVVAVDWEKHLPVMYNFWEGILFSTGNYAGNTMQKHIKLHLKNAMQPKHFERWLQLFTKTVDEHFEGPNAILIKQRALSIATVIQIKISTTGHTQ